jgi:predicted nucleic acid-binding protein
MIFLNTSYLVALTLPQDSLHATARAWSDHIAEPQLSTSYVLCEFANSLSAPARRARAHLLLESLISSADFTLLSDADEPLWTTGVELHRQRGDKEWSLTDCISFEVMKRRGISQALTYNHHIEQAGFDQGQRALWVVLAR